MEDLVQEGRIAFLRHLRKISDISQIHACKMDIIGAVWDYWVEMAIICIPRHRYLKEISGIYYISLDGLPLSDQMRAENEAASRAEVDDFLSTLTEQERTVVRMKLDACTSRAIMPYAGVETEVQMSRLMKRIRAKAEAYFNQ